MDGKEETFQTWNKIADLYESKFMDLDIYDKTYDYFLHILNKKSSKILDVGCGPGNISKYLLTKRDDIHLLGVDVSENMIELARRNTLQFNSTMQRVEFKRLDCRDISEIESKFDAIVTGFCIPYLSSKEVNDLIYDCTKLMNNNGCMYISFVEGNPENSGFKTGSSGDRMYFYFHQLMDIQNILIQHEFKIVEIIDVQYPRSINETEIHTVMIATSKK